MEKSFANLLRHSRLASYDKTIEQVYKTPKDCKKIGDWGLKRNLPTVIRTPHVIVKSLDTAEHQTPWVSGESKVLFIKRWKENFPNSRKPTSRSEQVQYNIATMTPAEFQRFLRKIEKQKAPEFKAALVTKQVIPEQVFEYLNVNVTGDNDKGEGVVGPSYSEYQTEWDYPVEGRILNMLRRASGHAVGVGGVVAYLPRRHTLGLKTAVDRKIRTFYVQEAEIDEEGKPRVVVTPNRKGASTSVAILNGYESFETQDYYTNKRSMTAADMWNTQGNNRHRPAGRPQSKDNVKPNPEHTDLMMRISSLLNTSQKEDK
ncbi:hypothetical protein G6F57_003005 [Rhizopus arrhizus]|jgi:hypothetical protein|uniref:Uncharacterized protein n=1 Tax=Rhizopus oryzae TaxID=64495 RepID=A0A9P6X9H2_RHIOR|nr:hypothetical protein G6F23_001768 [Rhizopus arrhizus]KAG1423975.1 hypothetical protein G6F58_002601 [Rhizopus delemar]KAG0763364.1 hypothetical protein G6F24_006081 [Rhizopus arrhizus]KAG0789891.1 hypothetical protein G6F21_006190 [Rhizopus arrhizus]KAG0801218.1 hypothetical protein G6F22_001468 [Rhizopus arrhizus]